MYCNRNKGEKKAYIILFTCSLTRAIHLELLPDQTTNEFIRALNRLIARRGCPETIYSDNAKTYVAASKQLKKINKLKILHHLVSTRCNKPKFNLSQAPQCNGQFDRMVDLLKNTLCKTLGKSKLQQKELEEVLIDVETTLNNKPLTYIEEDIQLPVLTQYLLVLSQTPVILNEDPTNIENKDLRKRQRYVERCKEASWKRWRNEYLTSLRERHSLKYKNREPKVKVGEVVVIKQGSAETDITKNDVTDQIKITD